MRFHEFIIFDTTFKSNSLNLPLATFVGVDNNNRNVVIAMCFLADETTESFEWLFSTLMSAVNGIPMSIMYTDQDGAMAAALTSTLPTVKHR